MKTKICTSIEQSRELIELGLDADTADMWYLPIKDTYELVTTPSLTRGIIPAWSLSALLNLLHIFTVPCGFGSPNVAVPSLTKQDKWVCKYVGDFKLYFKSDGDVTSEVFFDGDSPIDAVFNMAVYLIEQGYIKTEKK